MFIYRTHLDQLLWDLEIVDIQYLQGYALILLQAESCKLSRRYPSIYARFHFSIPASQKSRVGDCLAVADKAYKNTSIKYDANSCYKR
ncbi:hypothetical protein GCM10008022_34680 [Paenibacillus hunanensis]|nr:hypothetical protein GCM10008022_34680 [Paenibacillus hunanensis]